MTATTHHIQAYFQAAIDAVKANPKAAFTTERGTEQFLAWGAYFLRKYGRFPAAFKMIVDGQGRQTSFPMEWPEWFDAEYAVDHGGKPLSPQERRAILNMPGEPVPFDTRQRIVAKWQENRVPFRMKDFNEPARQRRRQEQEFRRNESLAGEEYQSPASYDVSPELMDRLSAA